jgi:MshEN domain
MSNDSSLLLAKEAAQNKFAYTTIDMLEPVQNAIQNLLVHGDEQIALVTIQLHYDFDDFKQPVTLAINRWARQPASFRQATTTDARHELAMRSTMHLLGSLRVLVRKTDDVFLYDHTMYFLLHGSKQQGGAIVQARLWEALLWRVHNMNEPEMIRPRTMTIGHGGYQEAQANLQNCIEVACTAQLHYEWYPEKSRKVVRQNLLEYPPELESADEELPTLARKLGIPYLALLPRKMPMSLQRLVRPSLAQELRCFPVGRERDTLTVAMLDPQDHLALDRLRSETGMHIFPVLVHPQALQYALEQLV